MGGTLFRILAFSSAAALLVGCGGGGSKSGSGSGGGGGADDGIHFSGDVVSAVGLVSEVDAEGQTAHGTIVDVTFVEHGDLTIPAPGTCQLIPTLTDPQQKLVTAGTVTLTGGSEATALTQGTTVYSFQDTMRAAWGPGATMTLKAAGSADVPAFTIAADAPGKLTVTSPTAGPTPVSVERGKGLTVTWHPLSNGQVFFGVLGNDAKDGQPIEVECRFEGGDGAGTVPASILMALATGTASLSVDAINLQTSTAGRWSIALLLGESAAEGVHLELH